MFLLTLKTILRFYQSNLKGRFSCSIEAGITHGGGCAKQLLLYQCPKCVEREGQKHGDEKGAPGLCLGYILGG